MSTFNNYWPDTFDAPVVSSTKGVDVLDGMLMEQYRAKPNLRAYFLAFFEEMDRIFKAADDIYLGRFLAYAVGHQLDVIGTILDQPRSVALPKPYFGYTDDGGFGGLNIDGFGHEVEGGGAEFIDENSLGFTVAPLSDGDYRKLLMMKAYCNNLQGVCNPDDVYYLASLVLGRYPESMDLDTSTPGAVVLNFDVGDISDSQDSLITYAAIQFFAPLGVSFIITVT